MSLAEFHFIRPYWFVALIPTLVISMLLIRNKLRVGNWSEVCDAELLPFILQQTPQKSRHWLFSSTLFACILAIIALAGPTWERIPTPVFRNDAALVIALNLSPTMDANDIKPSRLESARFKLIDILNQRKDGLTALIVYSGDAFIVSPLTEDVDTIINQVSALETSIMPSVGNRTDLAIKTAIELLKQAGLQQGDVLLMTDAVNLELSRQQLDNITAYRLSILGIGTSDGAPIKSARGGFLKDAAGSIVIPKLNKTELAQLARVGGGIYQTLSSDDRDIEPLLQQFDHPHKVESQDNHSLIEQWYEQGVWLLLVLLPLMALPFRKGVLSLTFLCLLPFPKDSYAMQWDDLWTSQNQQAQQAFQQQNYQQAAEQFEHSSWQAAAHYKAGQYQQAAELLATDQSAAGRYNLGNALAKSGKLQEAISAYDESLVRNPTNEDAKYNKQQVEKQLEQQKKQDENQQGDDKQESDDKDQQQSQDSESQQESSDKSEPQQNSEPTDKQSNNETEEQQSKPDESESADKDKQQKSTPTQTEEAEYDESEQASEQWLNTIPDNPAGLLKRKFKYQYKKRRQY